MVTTLERENLTEELWTDLTNGIDDPVTRLHTIVDIALASLQFGWSVKSDEIAVTITAIPADYHDLFGDPAAWCFSHVNGPSFGWLAALTNGIEIVGYKPVGSPPISPESINEYSRTDTKIMIRAKSGSYRLSFVGTQPLGCRANRCCGSTQGLQ